MFFLLTSLKTYALQVVQGRLCGMGQSKANQLSLSRLNHWLPRREAHPKVMERTAEFHHEIADALLVISMKSEQILGRRVSNQCEA